MSSDKVVPSVALVVKWENAAPLQRAAHDLLRRLNQQRMVATWAIQAPEQAAALLASTGTIGAFDTALLCPALEKPQELKRRIRSFLPTGIETRTIMLAAGSIQREQCRALHALGLRSVIATAADTGPAARPMPYGLWHFVPRLTIPAPKSWLRWLRRPVHKSIAALADDLCVASIDLAQLSSAGSHGQREMERLFKQLEESRRRGKLALVAIDAAAERLAESSGPRPQRSILRPAA